MTLLFIDGFEGYGKDDRLVFWDTFSWGGAGNSLDNILGRRGGRCWSIVSAFSTTKVMKIVPGIFDDWFIIGFAFYNVSGDLDLVQLGSGTEYDFKVVISEANALEFYFNSLVSNNLAFTSDPIENNTWYYLELKVTCKNSGGKMIARLDEQELFDWTGDSRSQTSPGYINSFGFQTQRYVAVRIDDIYVCNGQGTKNNDFLGDVRIDAINPNGAGNYTDLTPSAGANYECIDEDSYDDSDYIEGVNVGDIDSYTYVDVPTDLDDTAIYGIQLRSQSQRTAESDNIKIKGLLRTGSTDYKESTAQSLTDTFKSRRSIWEDDPSDSGDWTKAKINACEFGMEVA